MDIRNKEHEGQAAVSGIATLPVLREKMSPMVQLFNPILPQFVNYVRSVLGV